MYRRQPSPTHPLSLALWGLVALGLLAAVVAALTGLLIILALFIGLAVLNLVYLPRMAARLHIPVGWLALTLIPVMIVLGVALGGAQGAAWAVGLWLLAIGLPRAVGRDVLRRTRARLARVTYVDVGPTTRTADPAGRPLPPSDGPGQGEYGL